MSKILRVIVTLSMNTIARATKCLREGNTYHENWKYTHDSHSSRALYKENDEKVGSQKNIVYHLPCERAKIWENILNNNVLHKVSSTRVFSSLLKLVSLILKAT